MYTCVFVVGSAADVYARYGSRVRVSGPLSGEVVS